ncbi:MAG: tetratricopeptide repeat protein [Acidobacteriota bacterium]
MAKKSTKTRQSTTDTARGGRRRLWIVIAVLALVAVGAGWWWTQRDTGPREPTPETRAALEEALTAFGERRYDDGIDVLRAHLVTQPDAVGVHHLLGVLHGAQGEHEKAVDELELALADDPESVDTLYNLGLAHNALGEVDTANDYLRRALDQDSDRADAALLLGQNLKLAGATDEAALFLERGARAADAAGQPMPTGWFELGLIQRQRGELGAAERSMRKVLAARPDHLGALLNLGQILQRLGNEVESGQLLARHTELARAADELDLLQRTTQLETATTDDFLKLGRYQLERGDLGRAAEAFQGALARSPDDLEALLGLGRAQLDRGNIDGARGAFGRAVQAHGESFEAHFFFGLASHLAGDIETAQRAIFRSRELGDWGGREYTFLGNVFLATGMIADARLAYERAIEIDAERADAWYRLAFAASIQEDHEAAARAIDEVLERQPGDGDSLLLAGLARWHLQQRGDAEILLRKAAVARRVARFGVAADDNAIRQFETLPGHEEPLERYRALRELVLAGIPDDGVSGS